MKNYPIPNNKLNNKSSDNVNPNLVYNEDKSKSRSNVTSPDNYTKNDHYGIKSFNKKSNSLSCVKFTENEDYIKDYQDIISDTNINR